MTAIKPYPAYKDSGVEWLGEVPKHWEVRRLKSFAEILSGATPSSARSEYWSGDVLWITPEDLGRLRGREIHRSRRRITSAGYQSCGTKLAPARSTVVSTRAPIGHLAILGREACTNQGCRLLVPTEDALIPEWLYLGLLTARSELQVLGQGTTFAELSRDALGAFSLPLPPPSEQSAIAHFLDDADRRIRRSINAKKKLIELLEEQKQAIIQEAVTGRIDVRTGQPFPAYKDSGVPWLRVVPEHWEVRRSKWLFMPRKERARTTDIQLAATQAYGVIAQEDYEKRVGRKVVKVLRHLDRRRHVEVDDFVISMRSFQGGLERAWRRGCIRSSYVVLKSVTALDVGYFGYLFKSADYITALQSTANFIRDGQDLNFDNFRQVHLPFPPMEEQRRIAAALDRLTADLGSSLVERTRRQVELAREYRTRLIADVVTGKLDVREAAARLPEVDSIGGGGRIDATQPESKAHATEYGVAKEAGA